MVVAAGFIVSTSPLGELPGGHRAADTILDGDGLDGRGGSQAEGLAVEIALCGRSAAVSGVAYLGTVRSGDAYLGALIEKSGTTDYGSIHSHCLGTAVVTGAGIISVAGFTTGVATLAAAGVVVIGGVGN